MIEELKLLIPLLQSAGQGAFWVIIAMLIKDALAYLMWPLSFYIIGRGAASVVRVVLSSEEKSEAAARQHETEKRKAVEEHEREKLKAARDHELAMYQKRSG